VAEEEKVCPLLKMQFAEPSLIPGHRQRIGIELLGCGQEKCAWWRPNYKQCAIAVIADSMVEISYTMQTQGNK